MSIVSTVRFSGDTKVLIGSPKEINLFPLPIETVEAFATKSFIV